MTTREAEWDEKQRAYVRAYVDYQASSCSGCGGYLPDTTDPDSTYHATYPYRCKRCDALARKQSEYRESPHPQALTVWPVKGGPGGGSHRLGEAES